MAAFFQRVSELLTAALGAFAAVMAGWFGYRGVREQAIRAREAEKERARLAAEAEKQVVRRELDEIINARLEQLLEEQARYAKSQEERILHLQQRLEQVDKDRGAERDYYREVLKERDERATACDERIKSLEDELREVRADNIQIGAELRRWKYEHGQLKTEHEQLMAENQHLKRRVVDLEAQCDECRRRLAEYARDPKSRTRRGDKEQAE